MASSYSSISHISGRKILYFLFFFSFILSMNFWFGWLNRAKYFNTAILFFSVIIIIVFKIKYDFNIRNTGMAILATISYLLVSDLGLGSIIIVLTFFLVICLNDQDKIECLNFITKLFGYLMIPCIITYLLHFLVDLPSFGLMRAEDTPWAIALGGRLYTNHIFYMDNVNYAGRFNGPFMEPGHLGMMSAFLILVNHFDFKRKGMWPILVAVVLTLSLAGYVLLFLGFLMILFYRGKLKFGHLLGYAIIFLIAYLVVRYYNGGDNILNERILSRLQIDEDKGFSGNNRVFGRIALYYASMWRDPHTLLWGYPESTMYWLAINGSRGTGYIMWMCHHGLIGTFAVLLMYLFYVLKSKAKKYAVLCLIFVILMFWQRCYPFWTSWLICFVYGIVAEERSLEKSKEL